MDFPLAQQNAQNTTKEPASPLKKKIKSMGILFILFLLITSEYFITTFIKTISGTTLLSDNITNAKGTLIQALILTLSFFAFEYLIAHEYL
jgi:hypothetical protein